MRRKLITLNDVIDIELEYKLSIHSGERLEGSFTYWETDDKMQMDKSSLGEHVDLCLKSKIGTRYIRNAMIGRWNPMFDNEWGKEQIKTEVKFVCFEWNEELIKLIPAVKQ